MTEGLAIEIAKQMMKEQGIGDQYIIRFRHFLIPTSGTLEIKAHNELFILLRPEYLFSVSSMAGTYNLADIRINEMQYLHRGLITIVNKSKGTPVFVKMLQVIPKLKREENGRI